MTAKTTDLARLDDIVGECSYQAIIGLPDHLKPIRLAQGMSQLRKLVEGDYLDAIVALKDSDLGWRSDGQQYSRTVIRDCVIEALLRGARPIGNEFNVIAGRTYLTKAFFERTLQELDGLTDLKITEGVPAKQGDSGALVPMWASWNWQGRADELRCEQTSDQHDTRICVRVNRGMGADAILGKAKRKLLARIYHRLTGSPVSEDADTLDQAENSSQEAGAIPVSREEKERPQQTLLPAADS